MDTLPNNTNPVAPEPSLLDQIIQTSHESSLAGFTPPAGGTPETSTISVAP